MKKLLDLLIIPELPIWVKRAGILMAFAAIIPPVLIARSRVSRSDAPRIHIIPDMDTQAKFKAQARNDLFLDQRAMRPQVGGTVARDGLEADSHLHRGLVDGKFATTFPMPVTPELLARGRDRYAIYCAVCHGASGYGNGPIAVRADQLVEGGKAQWVPPTSYHDDERRARAVGHVFNTITNGIRTMPAYADQITPEDRWAIVAYVKALMRSQHATLDDVTDAEAREELEKKRK
jgi:mono/diheme cytochrome c family protein